MYGYLRKNLSILNKRFCIFLTIVIKLDFNVDEDIYNFCLNVLKNYFLALKISIAYKLKLFILFSICLAFIFREVLDILNIFYFYFFFVTIRASNFK